MTDLILRSAKAGRSGGPWDDDDYDVLHQGKVVGRIRLTVYKVPNYPRWFWSITTQPGIPQSSGMEMTREDAMQAFRARWDRLAEDQK